MLLIILLISLAVFLITQGKEGRSTNLVSKYYSLPVTTKKRVHIVLTLSPFTNQIIEKILKQTERSDMISIIVPEQYESQIKNGTSNFCKLVQDTCLVQVSGGYGMLAKEKGKGTIIVFVKDKPNIFLFPDTLKKIVTETETTSLPIINFHDAVVLKNSINLGVNDAYKVKNIV
ncbi:hypothetical protein IIV31_174L [Armadillidium vulgare iridescent virus]|uniref:Uncharacterized protein n=1 Tax=Armadillidium vulgare iridescent virus TaxID=72201 RepID=A0A068QKS2_9VIRU|nr:hypothetical protein IIV31_174L [Armadillidium vulgare iridescent virus]CCV02546.1 hypothetical protein IIV31_174L [Armadillidium vulgare iridescent virus]